MIGEPSMSRMAPGQEEESVYKRVGNTHFSFSSKHAVCVSQSVCVFVYVCNSVFTGQIACMRVCFLVGAT